MMAPLECHYGTPSLEKVVVVGVQKSRSKYRNDVWIIEGNYERSHVVAKNTPENVKRIKLYLKKKEEFDKLVDKRGDELQKISESIETLTP